MSKRVITLQEACELVPDDLPDGAYWAMAHEMCGAKYGEVWDELESSKKHRNLKKEARNIKCIQCNRFFSSKERLMQHEASMFRNGTHTRILTAQIK